MALGAYGHGYAAYGDTSTLMKAALAPGYFVKAVNAPNVLVPGGAALVLGVGGRLFFGGKANLWTGLASLGLLGYAAYSISENFKALWAEEADKGPAQAGAIVGTTVANTAVKIAQGTAAITDQDRQQVLANYSCYENARLANAKAWWWDRVRDPLKDCGLTPDQLTKVKAGFAKISRTDRARINAAYRSPYGSLKHLGDPSVPWNEGV